MKEFWDKRYSKSGYSYGEEPNEFLKKELSKLPVGIILFPAEGEGRNAVYAAKSGWKVYAFDQSIEAQKKAFQLAANNKVVINYDVGEFQTLKYKTDQFDAIALIYAHFPAKKKSEYHKKLISYLKKRGIIIF